MSELRKYATTTHVYMPIIKRGVVDFAVGADWTPAAGDVKLVIDGAAAVNITSLPTAIASGNGALWDFSFTTGEMTGKKIMVTIVDAATKAIEDQAFSVLTYGNASAEFLVDPTDGAGFGLSRIDAAVSSRMATFTLPTNFSSLVVDANGRVDISKWLGVAVNALISGRVDSNVGVNNDKTGYTLSSAGIQAIYDYATSLLTTVGSIGKLFVSNLDTNVGSRLPTSSYVTPLDAAGTRTAVGLASANIDTQFSNIPTSTVNADAILDRADGTDSITLRQILRLSLAAFSGPRSLFGTSAPVVKNPGGSKNRLTGSGIDANGNGTWSTDLT